MHANMHKATQTHMQKVWLPRWLRVKACRHPRIKEGFLRLCGKAKCGWIKLTTKKCDQSLGREQFIRQSPAQRQD